MFLFTHLAIVKDSLYTLASTASYIDPSCTMSCNLTHFGMQIARNLLKNATLNVLN